MTHRSTQMNRQWMRKNDREYMKISRFAMNRSCGYGCMSTLRCNDGTRIFSLSIFCCISCSNILMDLTQNTSDDE